MPQRKAAQAAYRADEKHNHHLLTDQERARLIQVSPAVFGTGLATI